MLSEFLQCGYQGSCRNSIVENILWAKLPHVQKIYFNEMFNMNELPQYGYQIVKFWDPNSRK